MPYSPSATNAPPSRLSSVLKRFSIPTNLTFPNQWQSVEAVLAALLWSAEGFNEFWNWFDSDSWYPLGRVVGGTVYPGIMITAATMYKLLTKITAWVQLRDVCVLTGPFFAGNTVSGTAGHSDPTASKAPTADRRWVTCSSKQVAGFSVAHKQGVTQW